MTDKYFKQDAKQIVDMVFDTKCFREDMTRDSLNAVEELIEYLIQSKMDTYIRCLELSKKIKNLPQQ